MADKKVGVHRESATVHVFGESWLATQGHGGHLFAVPREPSIDEVTATGPHAYRNCVVTSPVAAPENAAQLRNLTARIAPAAFVSGTSVEALGYPTSGTRMDQAYGALGVAVLVREIGPRDVECNRIHP